MPNLVIDIGNTQAKLAVFDGEQLLRFEQAVNVTDAMADELISQYNVDKVIVSSVRKDEELNLGHIDSKKIYRFNRHMVKNINNHYRTPDTLGIDRLAAVAGAAACYAGQNSLIIDAGTCITYDGIDTNNNYYGGSISPGLRMRFKAMHDYTAGLPMIEPVVEFDKTFGDDTASAMRSGVQNGIKYEVTGFVQQYFANSPSLNVLLTGGDANFLDTVLKSSIFAPYIKIEPYLVLKGLNAVIQQHND
ncbi:type III pantothenate kinase [Mucilaginibacter sp. KACC 22063]|uniref:type III pantothenate kinase n=1 Tax=Mucilaginibacter sp. KACC 22063 TaxID=3025666 RepID=UPI002365B77C|nr:type III pantothenate kinase [Mucilaginibacter sp. KACC 22063]WDF55084.1 type III pantothenate kinase [Mucilaginibacter sp. KACC 22063]